MPDLLFKVHDYLFKLLVIFLSHFNYLLWRCSVVPRGELQSIHRCSILIMLQWSIVKVFFVLWRGNQSNCRCGILVTLHDFVVKVFVFLPGEEINQPICVECLLRFRILLWWSVFYSKEKNLNQSMCSVLNYSSSKKIGVVFLLYFHDLLWRCFFYSQEKMDHSSHRCRVFLHASMICCEGVSSTPKRRSSINL